MLVCASEVSWYVASEVINGRWMHAAWAEDSARKESSFQVLTFFKCYVGKMMLLPFSGR